jgi:hypothetical protein
MALKAFLVGESATEAAFDALVADLPKTVCFGLSPETITTSRTGTTYSTDPQLTFKVFPLLGSHVHVKIRIRHSIGLPNTAFVKIEMQRGANKDQLVEHATTSLPFVLFTSTHAITALPNSGDCQGEDCQINVYLRTSDAVGTCDVRGIAVMSGASGVTGDYL